MAEKEVTSLFNLQLVDLFKCEHCQPWFVTLNPKIQVPVIKDGETVVVDSRNISKYLEDRFPQHTSLLPKDVQKATEIIDKFQAISWTVLVFGLATGDRSAEPEKEAGLKYQLEDKPRILRQILQEGPPELQPAYQSKLTAVLSFSPEITDPARLNEEWKKCDGLLQYLEDHLKKEGEFMMGGEYTYLDSHITAYLSRVVSLKRRELIYSKENLNKYWEQVQKRASFAVVYPNGPQ